MFTLALDTPREKDFVSGRCKPVEQWKSARTTNAIERLHEEFKAAHQDTDRAAFGRNGADAVLGVARLRPAHAPQGRQLADLAEPFAEPIDLPPEPLGSSPPEVDPHQISTNAWTPP